MKLSGLFLADYAAARDNLLSVVSGGITRVGARAFPAPCAMSLAGVITVDDDEQGEHRFTIVVRRVGGRRPARVEGSFTTTRKTDAPPGAGLTFALAVDLRPLALSQAGTYRITLAIDGRKLGEVSFMASEIADGGALT